MSKLMKAFLIAFGFMFLAVIACDTSGTRTETISEEELNEEVAEDGFVVDLQPGKILMSGEVEGMMIELEMTAVARDGGVFMELVSVQVDGVPLPADEFADMSAGLSEMIYSDDPDYKVDSVEITDDEIIITSSPE